MKNVSHLLKLELFKRRFTLIEVLIASAVIGIVLAALAPFMVFAVTSMNRSRKQADLDYKAWQARQWIKQDIRATSRSQILMYPTTDTAAECVSFPVIRRPDSDTSIPITGTDTIDWNKTILYHIYDNDATGKRELRRTVFSPRDNTLSTSERQQQMVDTLQDGDGSSTYNSSDASTQTFLDNVKDFRIASGLSEIDCYSRERHNESYSMGTWILDPGYHDMKIECTGKNNDSAGHNLGLDSMTVSASGTPYELESLLSALSSSGATPVHESMQQYTGWGNNAQVLFPAVDDGNSLTFKIHNDMWLESTFNYENAELEKTELTFNTTAGENICQLLGNDITWEASIQTLGANSSSPDNDYGNATVRTVIGGADSIIGGNIDFAGRKGKITFRPSPAGGTLEIEEAYIMKRTSVYNGDAATVEQLYFNDTKETSNITVFNNGKSLRLSNGATATSELFDLAIKQDEDYLLSLHISDDTGEAEPAVWEDSSGTTHGYMIEDDDDDVAGVGDWGSVAASDIDSIPKLVAGASLFVTYPEEGTYTSRILDTRMEDPQFSSVTWDAVTTADCSVTIKVRAGDNADLSGAPTWDNALTFSDPDASNSLSSLPEGRYVQWRAVLQASDPYSETAKLRNVNILWPGRRRGVDVGLAVEKASDMGKLKLTVDGEEPSPAALRMSFTTARKVGDGELRKSFAVDATPRNE